MPGQWVLRRSGGTLSHDHHLMPGAEACCTCFPTRVEGWPGTLCLQSWHLTPKDERRWLGCTWG